MTENYGIGGTEVQTDAAEAVANIPQNRTLMAEKLSWRAPLKPEVVHGLQTIGQVFAHFRPEVAVDFQDANGCTRRETLRFQGMQDFSLKGITEQSNLLKENATQKEEYFRIMRQLKANKLLKAALADPDAKQALLEAIRAMITEISGEENSEGK